MFKENPNIHECSTNIWIHNHIHAVRNNWAMCNNWQITLLLEMLAMLAGIVIATSEKFTTMIGKKINFMKITKKNNDCKRFLAGDITRTPRNV